MKLKKILPYLSMVSIGIWLYERHRKAVAPLPAKTPEGLSSKALPVKLPDFNLPAVPALFETRKLSSGRRPAMVTVEDLSPKPVAGCP